MLKVIFLDIDDTLLSFSECVKETMRTGFQKYGLKPYTEDMYAVFDKISGGLWQQLERQEITFEEIKNVRWNRVFQALGIEFNGHVFEEYFRRQLFDSAILEPGAMDLLKYLHRKYTVCAASNGPFEQQQNRLRAAGMTDYFDQIFISSKIGADKPSKEFFDCCFRTLHAAGLPDLRPEETIMIGDSMTSDIPGAKTYGMHTCLYAKEAPEMMKGIASDKAPDYLIRRLTDAEDFL